MHFWSYKRLGSLESSHRLLGGIFSYERDTFGRDTPETCDDRDHIMDHGYEAEEGDDWISGKMNRDLNGWKTFSSKLE